MNLHAYGQVHVDGNEPVRAELIVEQDIHVITTRARWPSSAWFYVDKLGHWHAAADDRTFPTLRDRSERAECDGSCGGVCEGEGYTRTVWTCRICGEEITPDFIEGEETTNVPGLIDWRMLAYTALPLHGEHTIRFISERSLAIGVGLVTELQMSSTESVSTIRGNGPIGYRKAGRG